MSIIKYDGGDFMSKKIKKIIAQVIICTMIIPNLGVNADINSLKGNLNSSIEHEQVIERENTEYYLVDSDVDESQENNTITDNVQGDNEEQNSELEESLNEQEIDSCEVIGGENTIDNSNELTNEVEDLVNSIYEEEVISTISQTLYRNSDEHEHGEFHECEREEFKLKAEGIANYSILKTKTDDEYEIALALSDGTYRFVNSAKSYDEAMEVLEKTPMTLSESEAVPVIINEYGQVVYSTKYVVKFMKNVNGTPHSTHIPYKDSNGNINENSCYIENEKGEIVLRPTHPTLSSTTNIYTNSKMHTAYTYLNEGYIDDAPAIESYSNAAKVMVNGYTGWIDNKVHEEVYNGKVYTWSDYVIIPTTHVTNPSYYISQGGILYHYISLDLQATANSRGTKIPIGVAPSYLRENVRYLSYDGNYFYDGTYIDVALNRIIDNANAGNKEHSVNKNNPYYAYYQYLPFRSKTVYNAGELDAYINANTDPQSKLRGIGQALKDAEKKYGVNALLTLGVAINESGWGMSTISQSKNNLFGINAVDSNPGQAANQFNTPGDSVLEFTKNYISRGYADPEDWRYFGGHLGNKNLGANVKYASDPFWGEKAAKYAFDIDMYLSGGISSLLDTNAYQVAIYNSPNRVVNASGELLYDIDNQWAFVGAPFVMTKKDIVNINGVNSYEIYPDRTTPVSSGEFSGDYDWNAKGYINATSISLINTQKDLQPSVEVLGGATRFETAVELSKSKFEAADTVVLINKTAILDGISATPLATIANGPILYTEANYLHEATKNEIARLRPSKVIIVGGSGVVTENVVNELIGMGIPTIDRLGGATRYDTSLEVAKYIDKNYYDVSEIFVVNGAADADAMSIGAVGGMNNMPIMLTEVNSMPANTYNWLKSENLTNAYIIGGKGIVTDKVLNDINAITKLDIRSKRVGGQDRLETNALVIDRFYGTDLKAVYAARSHILFDALAAGPIAAMDKAPVVLIPTDINQSQREVLSKRSARKIIQAGLDFPQQGINSLRRVLKIYDL